MTMKKNLIYALLLVGLSAVTIVAEGRKECATAVMHGQETGSAQQGFESANIFPMAYFNDTI